MARPGYTLPANLITEEELEEYSNEELGELFRAIIKQRVYERATPGLSRELKRLLRAVSDYDNVAKHNYEVNVANGKKGGRPITQQNPTKPNKTQGNPSKPIEIEIENEIEIEKKDIREINKEKGAKAPASVFHRPTLQEVKEYCEQRQNGIVAEQWYDYYEANGWKVGRNPMKDWKACIRSWEQRRKEEQANRPKTMKEEMHELYLKALEEDAREEAERDKGGNSGNSNPPFELLPF